MTRARVVGAAAALAVTAGVATTGGCGVFREDYEPRGEAASAAREGIADRLDPALATALGDLDPTARGSVDQCGRGQDNWKVRTEHAWECVAMSSALAVAATTAGDVAEALEAADARATELGCTPVSDRSGLRTTLEEYWLPEASGDPGALPEGRYTCRDGIDLVVEPTSTTDRIEDLNLVARLSSGLDAVTVSDRELPADALTGARPGALLLLTSVSTTYYAVDH